jgi:hypothetical protein
MHKVIVEEPRHGGGRSKQNRRANLPDELLPKKEGMRRPYTNRKWFGEHLGPLKRWLRSNVGRSWNDVYSEAAKVIKPNNVVAAHIRVHMFEMVQRHTFMRGGEVWCSNAHSWRGSELPVADLRANSCWPKFYVHPETGVLHEILAKPKRPRVHERPDRKWVSDNLVLQKLKGCWFACYLQPFEEDGRGPAFDLALHRLIAPWDGHAQYRRAVYCHRKRQLSSRELKEHGLKNDVVTCREITTGSSRVATTAALLDPARN